MFLMVKVTPVGIIECQYTLSLQVGKCKFFFCKLLLLLHVQVATYSLFRPPIQQHQLCGTQCHLEVATIFLRRIYKWKYLWTIVKMNVAKKWCKRPVVITVSGLTHRKITISGTSSGNVSWKKVIDMDEETQREKEKKTKTKNTKRLQV